MLEQEELRQILAEIRSHWNQAENDIKTAELVCNNIVMPSVMELRYAGRRLIDAMELAARDGDPADVRALINDALFDCQRARHDAIDSATARIAIEIELIEKKIGYSAILRAYPDFPRLHIALHTVRDRIAESRKDRSSREKIYSAIEAVDLPALVKTYNEMRSCEPIMRKLAAGERRFVLLTWVFGIATLAGMVVSVLAWVRPGP